MSISKSFGQEKKNINQNQHKVDQSTANQMFDLLLGPAHKVRTSINPADRSHENDDKFLSSICVGLDLFRLVKMFRTWSLCCEVAVFVRHAL